MSLRSAVSPLARRSPLCWTASGIVLLMLSACASGVSSSTAPSPTAIGLQAASSGMCLAIQALPNTAAVERAFTNRAHGELHQLAADPRLPRQMAARVLEAMQKVEGGFTQSPVPMVAIDDLAELKAAADAALQALGVDVPACES